MLKFKWFKWLLKICWFWAKGHIVGFGADVRADPKSILEAPRAHCPLEKAYILRTLNTSCVPRPLSVCLEIFSQVVERLWLIPHELLSPSHTDGRTHCVVRQSTWLQRSSRDGGTGRRSTGGHLASSSMRCLWGKWGWGLRRVGVWRGWNFIFPILSSVVLVTTHHILLVLV